MPARVVKDWLAEYKALPDREIHTYANTVRQNAELIDGLYSLFEDESSQEVLDPVCHQLFKFYRCGNSELKLFTLEAIPVMIAAYMTAHAQNDKKRSSGIEACLLGVYNLEVVGDDGRPIVKTYTIPTLAVPSVYHEPPSLATLALTESALLKHHSEEHVKITVGPLPQVERINSQNRLMTLTNILNLYNADIGNLSARSHHALCKLTSRVCKSGFDNLTDNENSPSSLGDSGSSSNLRSRRGIQFRNDPRIPLSSAFLVELLNGVYFTMFNGQAREGIKALEDIHQRALYELYPDVLLVTNAIKNSLMFNPSGQPHDGPMGISIALSPSQNSPAFSKSAITNASFRTKKLPEDIDVPDDDTSGSKPPSAGVTDHPPHYDDVVQQNGPEDKATSSKISAAKLGKPLKSIMKKGSTASEKQDKAEKTKKKDADGKKERKAGSLIVTSTSGVDHQDSHSPKNPKHSISVSTGLGNSASQNGVSSGDAADPSMVGVSVIRSSSSATGRTFQMVDYIDLKNSNQAPSHKRASSLSEDSTGSSANQNKTSQSREVSVTSNHDLDGLEYEFAEQDEDSIDTAL